MKLNNKVAIITGAGAGIGKATALLFASEGASVIVTDINEDNGRETMNEINDQGGEGLFIQHDVTKEEDWKHVVDKTLSSYKTIDILFNNAGIYTIKAIAETTVEEWNHVMSVNVTGTFLGMKHVLPIMENKRRGSIINASSVAGLKGAPGRALYGASKGAVRIMTKDVAMEYAPFQVRVNSIHPGFIKTDIADYAAKVLNTTVEEIGKKYPLGRAGEPDEVSKAVLFLASDDSAFITGTEMVIDGGSTASL
ncbi:glucose 1-dehydrogenase [bacterium LRH843]|nr:glucose 1-dehydrogenase [bacterium LRH843]